MIATFLPVDDTTKRTLNAGSAAGEPMSGLNAQVARRTRIIVPCSASPTVIPDGGQTINLSWSTWRRKTSGTLQSFGAMATPSTHETGTVEITAPDGAFLILSPAVLTSRKAAPVAGNTVGWSYNVLATDYAISDEAVDYILDLDHTVIRDLDGTIITDIAA